MMRLPMVGRALRSELRGRVIGAAVALAAAGLVGCDGGAGDQEPASTEGVPGDPSDAPPPGASPGDEQTRPGDPQEPGEPGEPGEPVAGEPESRDPAEPDPLPFPQCLKSSTLQLTLYIGPGAIAPTVGVVLTNHCEAAVTLGAPKIVGGDMDAFEVVAPTPLSGRVLEPSDSIEVRVGHVGVADEVQLATLVVKTEDGATVVEITLVAQPVEAHCGEDLVVVEGGSFGAIAVTGSETGSHAYVAGDTLHGASWRLARVPLEAPALEALIPVEPGDFSAMEANWIQAEAQRVTVYQFYPQSTYFTFHEATGEVTMDHDTPPPMTPPYAYQGQDYFVHVGSGDGDPCSNVCIRSRSQADGTIVDLLDDGEQPFALHTAAVYFAGAHVYFMTYRGVDHPEDAVAFRQMPLTGGPSRVLRQFDASWVRKDVHSFIDAWDGWLYWLRQEQPTQDSEPLTYIDRLPATGDGAAEVLTAGLAPQARALRGYGDRLIWIDAQGLKAMRTLGGPIETLLNLGERDPAFSLHFTLVLDRVYYTLTEYLGDTTRASLGCSVLP